jgi:hypothetical protein
MVASSSQREEISAFIQQFAERKKDSIKESITWFGLVASPRERDLLLK